MTILIDFFAFILSFITMEGVAWLTHKYVMHGFLWSLHRSHHEPHHGRLEKNDLFFVFYASIAVILMFFGYELLDYRFWMGAGVTCYGLTYFFLHDLFIHRRGKLPDKLNGKYFRAMT
jgi:beta-carotene 3-hydroxylase